MQKPPPNEECSQTEKDAVAQLYALEVICTNAGEVLHYDPKSSKGAKCQAGFDAEFEDGWTRRI